MVVSIVEEEKKDKQEKLTVIRPPYFDKSLIEKCRDCEGFCVKECEENIIERLEDGSPYLVFKDRGCTFCRKCSDVCPENVISYERFQEDKIYAHVCIITDRCFAWNKIMCFSCSDACVDSAVVFKGLFNPEILSYKCTGCGFCITKCPAFAIEIRPSEVEHA